MSESSARLSGMRELMHLRRWNVVCFWPNPHDERGYYSVRRVWASSPAQAVSAAIIDRCTTHSGGGNSKYEPMHADGAFFYVHRWRQRAYFQFDLSSKSESGVIKLWRGWDSGPKTLDGEALVSDFELTSSMSRRRRTSQA